ncbi:hypothetical protein PJI17_20160 [Mycobacterium kansasii]
MGAGRPERQTAAATVAAGLADRPGSPVTAVAQGAAEILGAALKSIAG